MRCLLACFLLLGLWSCADHTPPRVLIFSRTNPNGYRHQSIEAGKAALQQLCYQNGIWADTTEDQRLLTEPNLKRYAAVIFLNTNGDVLDPDQEADFERYIQAGGGFVGVHAASACEYTWRWFGGLLGGYFKDHPAIQDAALTVNDCQHPATAHLGCADWPWQEEWYNFRNYEPDLQVLLSLDESKIKGATHPASADSSGKTPVHPLAWCHEYDGGRAFYTALGHQAEAYADPRLQQHLLGGIRYAIGDNQPLNYARARTQRRPDQSRFVKTVVADHLREPMELAVLPTGQLLVIERHGYLNLFDPAVGHLRTVAKLPVYSEMGDGLIGLAVDPQWRNNGWIYLYYSSQKDSVNQLSRFVFRHDTLDWASERVILQVPVERTNTFHAAGSIAFGPDGYLYLATGDNTSPFASDGFSPSDERPGRRSFDAQRSSANLADLRGKILRIKVLPDGTYTCPPGNLSESVPLPPGRRGVRGGGCRPEIYVAGCRNPFRISVDPRRNYLYWGEIGPDAGKTDTVHGPMGHDEINQARRAGFYGWPYFVGDNQAYRKFDFATQTSGPYHDPAHPRNTSPNNTGPQDLPPAQAAFIWYPYGRNRDFPILGTGGRNAMAGPTYYADEFPAATRFPDYYHDKTIVYDWMRGWLMAVTVDSLGRFSHLEPFADSVRLSRPMDLAFDQNGTLWLLEYGQRWYSTNDDARLSRIDYVRHNRPPVARLRADVTAGAAPLRVVFSVGESEDYDHDELTYEIDFQDGTSVEKGKMQGAKGKWQEAKSKGQEARGEWQEAKGKEQSGKSDTLLRRGPYASHLSPFTSHLSVAEHVFTRPGTYEVTLLVKDPSGARSTVRRKVVVGNAPPVVRWDLAGHSRSFYRPGDTLHYQILVNDLEDGQLESGIPSQNVATSAEFFPKNVNPTAVPRRAEGSDNGGQFARGKTLVSQSDCYSCHAVDRAVNGPAFQAVAERYRKNVDFAVATLYRKIIYGGSGNWGQRPMSAHPQIREEDAIEMARWILALGDPPKPVQSLPLTGTYVLNEPVGAYVLRADYRDRGATGGVPSLESGDFLVLRPARFEVENCDGRSTGVGNLKPFGNDTTVLNELKHNAWFVVKRVDLAGLQTLTLRLGTGDRSVTYCGGRLEVHANSPGGPLLGTLEISRENEPKGPMRFREVQVPLAAFSAGESVYADVYFVFKNEANQGQGVAAVDWVEF